MLAPDDLSGDPAIVRKGYAASVRRRVVVRMPGNSRISYVYVLASYDRAVRNRHSVPHAPSSKVGVLAWDVLVRMVAVLRLFA